MKNNEDFFLYKRWRNENMCMCITITCTRLKKHWKDFKKMIYMEIF